MCGICVVYQKGRRGVRRGWWYIWRRILVMKNYVNIFFRILVRKGNERKTYMNWIHCLEYLCEFMYIYMYVVSIYYFCWQHKFNFLSYLFFNFPYVTKKMKNVLTQHTQTKDGEGLRWRKIFSIFLYIIVKRQLYVRTCFKIKFSVENLKFGLTW